jgi:hypothetical protein
MATAGFSETLTIFCHTTRHHILEDGLDNPKAHDVIKSKIKALTVLK